MLGLRHKSGDLRLGVAHLAQGGISGLNDLGAVLVVTLVAQDVDEIVGGGQAIVATAVVVGDDVLEAFDLNDDRFDRVVVVRGKNAVWPSSLPARAPP
jgi:hypothetical protein